MVILESGAGMVENGDYTHLGSSICELTSRVWIQERRMQSPSMSSVKVRSARKAAKIAAERKVVKSNEGGGLSSSSPSEKLQKGEGRGGEEKWEKGVNHGIRKYKVIKARRLSAMSKTLP